jgi:RND family efflux transporter MFP subunit
MVYANGGSNCMGVKRKRSVIRLGEALALFALTVISPAGCGSTDKSTAVKAAGAASVPRVAVVAVKRQNLSSRLEIASEFQPFQEIDVYAKVSGYVRQLDVDWGTHVHTGQLLAVLEIPELELQIKHDEASLAQAQDELDRAQSAYKVAHLTFERLSGVQKTRPELISQQDIDVAQGKDLEEGAAVSGAQQSLLAARAALDKDKILYAYSHMTAPFDAVVTKMYAYTGALLPAGTSSNVGSSALCRLSQNNLLRLVIPIPERAVPGVRAGEIVTVNVSTLQRKFDGKIVRFSDQIDAETRTMHTEVAVANPNYELVPGMYATVEIPLQTEQNVLVAPVQAVQSSGEGRGNVLVVDRNNKIQKREVTLGLQGTSEIEVVSGLDENDLVVVGEQSQFQPGESVEPKIVANPEAQ